MGYRLSMVAAITFMSKRSTRGLGKKTLVSPPMRRGKARESTGGVDVTWCRAFASSHIDFPSYQEGKAFSFSCHLHFIFVGIISIS